MWWNERMVAFDLETTSAHPSEARIVTASIVEVGDKRPTTTRAWLVDPGIEIPAEASAIHGITTEQARTGTPAAEAVRDIAETIAKLEMHPLVIFNARYDLTVLDRECRRHGIGPLPLVFGPVIDPLVIDKHLDRYRPGSRKLAAICQARGANLDGAHDAGADALAAARLAWVLGAKGFVNRRDAWDPQEAAENEALRQEWQTIRGDLPALYEAQRRWAWDQADGLRLHFVETAQHDNAAEVRSEWPVVPLSPSGSSRPPGEILTLM